MPDNVRSGTNQVTLARALSKLGVASRSQSAELIVRGDVKVNGKVVLSPDVWVDPRKDKIVVGGKEARRGERIYLAMHKPASAVTTRSDELGRKTIYDFIPAGLPWLFPIGRLDKDTSGLLLLTNDTRFGERITSPLEKVPKIYEVGLDRALQPADQAALELPMRLKDGTGLKPALIQLKANNHAQCNVTIHEGKNRQIRRMFEQRGYTVVTLKRISIAGIRLGELKEGSLRALTPTEIASIERKD